MILVAWRLMPATVHPHFAARLGDQSFYFTNRTLSENESPFVLHTGSPRSVADGRLQLRRQIYFTNRTLSEHESTFALHIGPPSVAEGSLQLRRQIYFTNRTLSENGILRLSNGTVVGLTHDNPPSSHCVLTAKMFRTTKSQP